MLPRRLIASTAILALLTSSSCGGGTKSPTTPSGPVVVTTTVTITAAGVNPKDIQVSLGARVLFVNNDTSPHEMGSDPHPEHTDCTNINQVGFLQPGQSRETGNFVQTRVCGYHDHRNPDVPSLRGSITIK